MLVQRVCVCVCVCVCVRVSMPLTFAHDQSLWRRERGARLIRDLRVAYRYVHRGGSLCGLSITIYYHEGHFQGHVLQEQVGVRHVTQGGLKVECGAWGFNPM